jgi:peptidyl-prolyl cis-trans isomerase SurA
MQGTAGAPTRSPEAAAPVAAAPATEASSTPAAAAAPSSEIQASPGSPPAPPGETTATSAPLTAPADGATTVSQPVSSVPVTSPPAAATQAPAPSPAASTRAVATTSRLLDRIVAVVNDEVITNGELEYRIHLAETQLTRQRIAIPPADLLRKQILERLIVDRAQLQLAKETGVRVDDGTVNAAVGRMAEQNGMNIQAMRSKVESDGVSFNQFREDMRDEITMMRVRDREVDAKIQISEGEIDNFLQEQSSILANTVEYDVAQILIGVPEIASPEFVERARRRTEDLYAQLRAGADFARLAAGYSAAPEALQGGDLGWRSIDRLPTLFADAIRKIRPGEMAAVRSPVGFHILKLVGQRNATNARISNQPVAQTHARHILLRVTDALPEAEVRHRLQDLRERIVKGGQDFGQLARLYSVDPSSTRGGDLGWLYPNDTVPAFEAAMNALKVNEVSEPVQSPFGWHLIQVQERRTEESSIERKRLEARQALKERKSEEALQEWLRQLRDRTYVEYRLEDNR